MSVQELERLVRKFDGYVADLEGSGIETCDLLLVRDTIHSILEESTPEQRELGSLFAHIHELDCLRWAARETFVRLMSGLITYLRTRSTK